MVIENSEKFESSWKNAQNENRKQFLVQVLGTKLSIDLQGSEFIGPSHANTQQ